jgi:MFS family permease
MSTASVTEPANAPEWDLQRRAGVLQRRVGVLLLHFTTALLGTVATGKGVFFPKLVEAFSLSHAAGAALISASSVIGGAIAFGVGWLMLKRIPVQRVIITVPLLSGAGYLVASLAGSYRELLIGYVLMSGNLVTQVAIAFLLTRWFSRGRGLALAIVYSGTTTGGVLLTPLLSAIVEHWGWRAGYQTLAISLFVLSPLLWWMLRGQSARDGQGGGALLLDVWKTSDDLPGLTVSQALATRSFWLMVFANFIFGANTGTYFVHFISLLESTGHTAIQAALTMSQLFLLAAGAKLIFGFAGDRTDIRRALAISLLMSALGWWLLQQFDGSQWALYGFTLIFGLSYSGPLVLFPLLASSVFGKRSFSLIDAIITVVGLSIGGAVGPTIAGRIYDVAGTYHLLFTILAISLVAAAAATVMVRDHE